MTTRPFRFGFQITGDYVADPVGAARRAEAVGFDIALVADHVGLGLSPMPTLGAIAAGTDDIRIGTFVLNSDMRNPVQLAWEALTLDRLSGGRFELGLGAGHTPHEYTETGVPWHPPAVRKRRLAERFGIIRSLLDGETVDLDGEAHQIENATLEASVQDRLPMLVGGNGAALLGHAGAHADIIGLQGLGRTREDGHRHHVKFSPERLDDQLQQVRDGAGDRLGEIEFNALVQFIEVTESPAATDEAIARLATEIGTNAGFTADEAREIPYLLVGTVDEIAAKLHRCRDRWGITYFAVRMLDDFAPVIAAAR